MLQNDLCVAGDINKQTNKQTSLKQSVLLYELSLKILIKEKEKKF